MMKKNINKKALFTNFSGWGNAIMEIPMLKNFEANFPTIQYYHTENILFKDSDLMTKVKLKNLIGQVPSEWRGFKEVFWRSIYDFIIDQNINIIINFRNEGPAYDIGYYGFKWWVKNVMKLKIEFWDINFDKVITEKKQKNIREEMISVFEGKSINMRSYNPYYLSEIYPKEKKLSKEKYICVNPNTSQHSKRWPLEKWVSSCEALLANENISLNIILGTGPIERQVGIDLFSILNSVFKERVSVFEDNSLDRLITHLSKYDAVISTDTGVLHASNALNIPTVGIFITTSAKVWGGTGKHFLAIQSKHFGSCPQKKEICGNCTHYYQLCPVIEQNGDGVEVEKVVEALDKLI